VLGQAEEVHRVKPQFRGAHFLGPNRAEIRAALPNKDLGLTIRQAGNGDVLREGARCLGLFLLVFSNVKL